jgi:hypothetical protein
MYNCTVHRYIQDLQGRKKGCRQRFKGSDIINNVLDCGQSIAEDWDCLRGFGLSRALTCKDDVLDLHITQSPGFFSTQSTPVNSINNFYPTALYTPSLSPEPCTVNLYPGPEGGQAVPPTPRHIIAPPPLHPCQPRLPTSHSSLYTDDTGSLGASPQGCSDFKKLIKS